jgi:2-desacetyl-2-hydroxyethyl bacteriochlorophyllide A dehydrogenase
MNPARAVAERHSVVFAAPGKIEVICEAAPLPGPGEMAVETIVSAISPGTEMLFYRGQVPPDMAIDSTFAGMDEPVHYPLRYGYACVGRVTSLGPEVDPAWLGRLIFAFHPHTSRFVVAPAAVIPVPAGLSAEQAALLPVFETAVNLVMDGRPAIGEVVAVVGAGIVGLCTTALLAGFPLAEVWVVDPLAARRDLALTLGASHALSPGPGGPRGPGRQLDADLCFELSGNPAALDTAIAVTGYAGRIVVGSWYGEKRAPVALGGKFHRSRIRLLSSQVSTVDPAWGGRWDKQRRLRVAWAMLERVPVDRLITHRIPVSDSARAYEQIDRRPEETIQVLLTYGFNVSTF